ncbi:flavin reductase family protein [Paenarthrobacter ureafaciens]|nr:MULTISPECIES: flavin reductase family protein [unclassified Paenarthrobacter]QMU81075.1 flavin reductase family protein [Paenarthrobacter ureafaciens]
MREGTPCLSQEPCDRPDPGFDPRVFGDTLGHYASGITIISGIEEDGPIGFTCQSFYSVSTEPPLVSFSVMTNSTTYPRLRETGKFVVNVLAHDQDTVSNQFARKGTDKWAGIDWSQTNAGNPVIGRFNETSPATWHKEEPRLYFKGQYRHRHLHGADEASIPDTYASATPKPTDPTNTVLLH